MWRIICGKHFCYFRGREICILVHVTVVTVRVWNMNYGNERQEQDCSYRTRPPSFSSKRLYPALRSSILILLVVLDHPSISFRVLLFLFWILKISALDYLLLPPIVFLCCGVLFHAGNGHYGHFISATFSVPSLNFAMFRIY